MSDYLPYIKDGKLYNYEGKEIIDPSILIDGDVLLRYGFGDTVESCFNRFLEASKRSGLETDSVCLIKFNELLPLEDILYIYVRGIEFTATGFLNSLRLKWGTDEFLPWLEEEKSRIPLSLIYSRRKSVLGR